VRKSERLFIGAAYLTPPRGGRRRRSATRAAVPPPAAIDATRPAAILELRTARIDSRRIPNPMHAAIDATAATVPPRSPAPPSVPSLLGRFVLDLRRPTVRCTLYRMPVPAERRRGGWNP